jgi:hypothetical protein
VGNSAAAYIFHEDALFIIGRFAAFRVESLNKLARREIVAAFLFQRTSTERVFRADAIIVRV